MTQYVKIPVTELAEVLHSIEDLLFNMHLLTRPAFRLGRNKLKCVATQLEQ